MELTEKLGETETGKKENTGRGKKKRENSVKLNRANYYARRASRATDTIELNAIVLEQTVNRTRARRIYIFHSL